MAEELKFPETHLDELKASFDRRKAQGVIDFIGGFNTIDERKALHRLAHRTFGLYEKPDLDALIVIVKAGMKDLLDSAAVARSSGDTETANSLTDAANAACYNLAADLAECWPGDNTPRTQYHFETGLDCALDCLRWRNELRKGLRSFSIAWWAKGAHELSLGRAADAVDSFRESRRYSEAVLAEKEEKQDPNTDFGCVLANGYLGLALAAAGDRTGERIFQQACDAFTALILKGGQTGANAKFGLDQIQTMQRILMAREEGKGIMEESKQS